MTEPTDAEAWEMWLSQPLTGCASKSVGNFTRAVLAKWGTPPAGVGEPVAWYEYNADLDAWFLAYSHNPKAKTRPLVFGDTTPQPTQAQAVNQADRPFIVRLAEDFADECVTAGYVTTKAPSYGRLMDEALSTQEQAGAVPLTDIRKAALDLYTPPFRHEYGYIRDANHHMVADDAGSEGSGLIASRIRGWGRIQYMDKPEQRAASLQDEVAEIVAEALNAYWAANGIKGGQHGL